MCGVVTRMPFVMSEGAGFQVKKTKKKGWIFLTGHKALRLPKLMYQLLNLFISQLFYREKKKTWHLFGALLFCSSVIYTLPFSLMWNTKMFTGPRGGGQPYWTST